MHHTLFLHVDSEALVEPAGLALVPPDHVHHTPAIVLAEIIQSPGLGDMMTDMTKVQQQYRNMKNVPLILSHSGR